jgi:hypothetical protein
VKRAKAVLKVAGIFLIVVLLGVTTLIGMVRWEHAVEMTLPNPRIR